MVIGAQEEDYETARAAAVRCVAHTHNSSWLPRVATFASALFVVIVVCARVCVCLLVVDA